MGPCESHPLLKQDTGKTNTENHSCQDLKTAIYHAWRPHFTPTLSSSSSLSYSTMSSKLSGIRMYHLWLSIQVTYSQHSDQVGVSVVTTVVTSLPCKMKPLGLEMAQAGRVLTDLPKDPSLGPRPCQQLLYCSSRRPSVLFCHPRAAAHGIHVHIHNINLLSMVAHAFSPRTQGHADLCELKLTLTLLVLLYYYYIVTII